MFVKEGNGFLPCVFGLLFAITVCVGRILKAVTGAIVAMKFAGHNGILKRCFVFVDVVRGWILVFVAKNAEDRVGQFDGWGAIVSKGELNAPAVE